MGPFGVVDEPPNLLLFELFEGKLGGLEPEPIPGLLVLLLLFTGGLSRGLFEIVFSGISREPVAFSLGMPPAKRPPRPKGEGAAPPPPKPPPPPFPFPFPLPPEGPED